MTKSFFTKTSIAASVLSLSIFNTTANATELKFYAGGGLDYTKYGFSKQFKKHNLDKLKGGGISLAPVIGVKFHENFAVEAGHSFSKKITGELTTPGITDSAVLDGIYDEEYLEAIGRGATHEQADELGEAARTEAKQTKTSKMSFAKVSNTYLDFIGTMPVADGKFNLIGGLGIGRVNLKLSGQSRDAFHNVKVKNKFAYRIKVGAEYNVTNNIAVRALLAYQKINNKLEITNEDGSKSSFKPLKDSKSLGLSVVYKF